MPSNNNDGGLGSSLVGEKVVINSITVTVTKLIGEGEGATTLSVAIDQSNPELSFSIQNG
jgi:hypothetical protein